MHPPRRRENLPDNECVLDALSPIYGFGELFYPDPDVKFYFASALQPLEYMKWPSKRADRLFDESVRLTFHLC